MASVKQIEANRKNSLASTGPKTREGKVAVAKNAVKHGLLSRKALVPGEDENAFEELRERIWTELHPVGVCEESLVERIAMYTWRLRRIAIVDAYLLAPRDSLFGRTFEEDLAHNFYNSADSFSTLTRYEVCIERMMAHAFNDLRNLQSQRLSAG